MAEQNKFLKLGPWLPDRSEFNTPGIETATNVIRTSNGYRPFASLQEISFAGLPLGQPTGFFFGKDALGNARMFAAIFNEDGTDTGLYELSVAGAVWVRVGTWRVTTDNRFHTAQNGDEFFITNFSEGLRNMDLGSDADFSEVNFAEGGQVKPKYLAIVRDFLVGCFNDDPDNRVNNRCRWSAINNFSSWSLAGDPTTLSDFQDVPDAGEFRGIVGGEWGTLLMEHGVYRMDFVGAPAVFSFNRVENARGCETSNSIITEGQNVYYLAEDGWVKFDGQTITPIGAERFDRFFSTVSDAPTRNAMSAFVDPNNTLIIWAFNGFRNANDVNDLALLYDYVLKEATLAEFDCSLMGNFISPGFKVEDLNTLVITDPTGFKNAWVSTVQYLIANPANAPADTPDRVWHATQAGVDTIWTPTGPGDPAIGDEPGVAATWTAFINAPDYQGIWSVTKAYSTGNRVSHVRKIWEALSPAPALGTEPGVDAQWQENATEIAVSIDDLAAGLDDNFYKAGAPIFGALKTSETTANAFINTFTGPSLPATIDTSEERLGGRKRARILVTQPAIEGQVGAVNVTVQIGTRNRQGAQPVFSAPRNINVDGVFNARLDSRFQRFRLNITGNWDDATGVFVTYQPSSLR